MTKKDDPESGDEAQGEQRSGAAALAAAAKHAQQALDSAKGIVSGAHLDEVGAKATAKASTSTRKAASFSPAMRTCRRRPSI
jgi:hypothetical protein